MWWFPRTTGSLSVENGSVTWTMFLPIEHDEEGFALVDIDVRPVMSWVQEALTIVSWEVAEVHMHLT